MYDCLRGAPGGLSRSTRIMRLPCSGGEPVFTLLLLLLRGGVVVFAGGPGCFTIDLGKVEKAVSFFEKRFGSADSPYVIRVFPARTTVTLFTC